MLANQVHSTSINLRPLSLGEILDRSLRLYRRNFLAFAGAAAIVMLPLNLLQSGLMLFSQIMQTQALESGNAAASLAGSVALMGGGSVTGLVGLVLTIVAQTAISRATADVLMGQTSGVFKAYRRLGPIAGNLLVMVMLLGALSIGLGLWAILVPCIGWLTGPAAVVFLQAAIIPLSSVIISLERHTPLNVIRRAWEISRQRFWWMLGFSVVLGLFNLAVSLGPTALLEGLALSSLSNDSLMQFQILNTVVSAVSALFVTIIMTPLIAVAFTLVYFDLRIRYEGLDLLLEAHGPVQDIAEVTSQAVAPQAELLRSQDMLNMAKFTLLIIGLYLAFFGVIFGVLMIISTAATY